MHIVFGQQGVERTESEISGLIRSIHGNGCGTGLAGCFASPVEMNPLSWAITVNLPVSLLEDYSLEEKGPGRVMLLIKTMAASLGPGKYHFRGGSMIEFSDFWDLDCKFLVTEACIFGGVPLSISVTQTSNVVEIPMDWVNRFVNRNYSHPLPPFVGTVLFSDTLRNLYMSVCQIMGIQGPWTFKINTGQPKTESNAFLAMPDVVFSRESAN